MSEASKQTPMMRQYMRFKADYPDTVLFFHLGDFYETFFDDAELAARELDIVLTSRNGHPMAGVPVRRGESYVHQLLKRGYKVAVCQQVEDPKKAKGLVKRDVVRVVTPGTAIEDSVLEDGVNNYLCAVDYSDEGERHGVAFLDLSTGEFATTVAEGSEQLGGEIARRGPSEILLADTASVEAVDAFDDLLTTRVPAATFAAQALESSVLGAIDESGLRAAGAILAYVARTQKSVLAHIRSLESYRLSDRMDLDPFTVTSLELVRPLREGQERGTLLHVLDRTGTSMGRRRLRRMILAPLTDRAAIDERLDGVGRLVEAPRRRQELRERIGAVHDVERLIGKLGAGRMRPLDLLLLLKSLEPIGAIAGLIVESNGDRSPARLAAIAEALSDPELDALAETFSGMLVDQPPPEARDGGIVRAGYSSELDALRREMKSIRAHLTTMEQEEREKTGIPSLKVGFNRVFGYYLEVTRTHLDKVPETYHRRQTLANAERFVTEELKEFEERISSGEERSKALELELFEEALARLREAIPCLQRLADAIAELDVLLALADNAHRYGYVRPKFTDRHESRIRGGRHPVVERIEEFVPNDLDLEEGRDLVILTGPNMAGKCLVENTLVFSDQGMKPLSAFRPAASRPDTFTELEIAVRGRKGVTRTSHFYDGGVSPVLRIRTRLGFELTGTPAHRLWVRNADGTEGWKALSEISTGDVVSLAQQMDLWGDRLDVPDSVPNVSPRAKRYRLPDRLTPDLSYLLGLLAGDGTLTGRNAVRFSTGDTFLGEEFRRIVLEQFGYRAGFTSKRGTKARGWYVTSQQIRAYLKQLGLGYVGAANKNVPWSVLQAPREIVVAFLQGLFDTDGSADKRYGNLELSTTSSTLAHQVQLLLLNLGIVSTRQGKQTSCRPAFRVSIYGEAALVFYEKVGFRLPRKQDRRRLASETRRPNIGGIPHLAPVLKRIQERIVSTSNKPVALKHAKRINSIFYTYVPKGRNPSYSKIAELASYCYDNGVPCPELDVLLEDRYFYDSVESVEPAGVRQVCDLSVPDGNAYAAAAFVSHNSVYLRQTALISLMAQIGSFVPASEAVLPIVDRVFARVGASDMLSAGISTFMMEMLEVATILQRATSRSLIILDEMGRGTSTFDGVSIAWAVAKELASRVRAKTLFATHYQELTRLVDEIPNAVNLHVVVKEVGREVVFLHRVEPGTASGSYGVHVARLAGLPDRVTEVADRILTELLAEAPLSQLGGQTVAEEPLPLFGSEDHPIVVELRKIDPERITPLEALQILADLRSRLD